MWLNGIRRTLIRWWLIAVWLGFVVPSTASEDYPPLDAVVLAEHPQCDRSQSLPVQLDLNDFEVGLYISNLDTVTGVSEVRVRRGGSLENVGTGTYSGPLSDWKSYEDMVGRLNGALVLCIAPWGVTLMEAGWSLFVDKVDATLESSDDRAPDAIQEFSCYHSNNGATISFMLIAEAAELTIRETGESHPVSISVYFGAQVSQPEPDQ